MGTLRICCAAALALALAGCGNSSSSPKTTHATSPGPTTTAPQSQEIWVSHLTPGVKRTVAILERDIRHIAATKGEVPLEYATSDFIDHMDRSQLGHIAVGNVSAPAWIYALLNHEISRAITATVGARCDMCFNMLEAARPLPKIGSP